MKPTDSTDPSGVPGPFASPPGSVAVAVEPPGAPPAREPSTDSGIPALTHVPAHVWAVLLASTSVIVGVIWDISWHRSIGRDSFWSPPHLAIYFGGLVAGVTCGWRVLRISFGGDEAEREAAVSFWRIFRGPLGAWLCIWGTFAMLTSAPFDDWWHNAYGLDVQILSPPHAVLALGIAAINLGALVFVLAYQNRAPAAARRAYGWLFAYAAGLLVSMAAILTWEETFPVLAHGSGMYKAAAIGFPPFLVAAGRAGSLRWPATAAAAWYSAVLLLTLWILQIFPAEPRLAPIYQDVARMVPHHWPLLVVLPALGIDVVLRRYEAAAVGLRGWLLAAVLGATFFVLLVPAQWGFSHFQLSPWAENWVFGEHRYAFDLPSTSYTFRHEFIPAEPTEGAFRRGLLWAMLIAMVTSRAGLALGNWMRRVRR